MSSAFDKSPGPGEDPGHPSGHESGHPSGHENTASFGQPVPGGQGAPPPGYGVPAGGYGPPPGYGYPSGYGFAAPDHPKASTCLVLGILGVVLCQVVSPFAWVVAKRTLAEIDASQGRWGGRGQAQAGYVLGIVGTVLLGLAVAGLLLYLVVISVAFGGFVAGTG